MKFRLQLEELDGRIVPSATPVDPPSDPPPANPGSPAPSAESTDAQLMTLLTAAETTGDYAAVQQYLSTTYGATETSPTDPGTGSTGSGNDANAQPTVTPPPTTTIPLPKPPFSPIPTLADIPAQPNYPTVFTNTGGRAATAAELAELKDLDKQIVAIDIAKTRIAAEQVDLAKKREGLQVAIQEQAKVVAAAQTAVTSAQREFEMAPSVLNTQTLKNAQTTYAASKAALDLMNSIQTNIGQRIDYLKTKIVELDALRVSLVGRRDAILSALVRNVDSGPKLNYQLPVFIDWKSPEWIGFDKPLPVLKAKALGE